MKPVRDGLSGGRGVAGVIQGSPPARRYQRTGNTIIRPLLFKTEICAFDLARAYYEEYRNDPDPAKRLVFEDDLLDYMRTGFVCVRPKLFAMVKVVDHEGERMWFIRIAIGDLCELISVLPFYLERMCFCRDNRADSMRIVSTKRLAQVAMRMANTRMKLKEAA